jgi:hypothetical protein
MPTNLRRKKQGIVILLDALGASAYEEEKIKNFLSARDEIIKIVGEFAKKFSPKKIFTDPNIYTFGDTIVITVQFKGKKKYIAQIMRSVMLMRRYLFHSFKQGILFRGAFSIGSYIEDSKSNTVMGEAVTDAAQWYGRADWMGIISTPKTNNALEYYCNKGLSDVHFIHMYPVPLKDGSKIDLYCISWPGALHDKMFLEKSGKQSPRLWFLEIFKDFSFPISVTTTYYNTKLYFNYVENKIEAEMLKEKKPTKAS